jgi:hypothetical protein
MHCGNDNTIQHMYHISSEQKFQVAEAALCFYELKKLVMGRGGRRRDRPSLIFFGRAKRVIRKGSHIFQVYLIKVHITLFFHNIPEAFSNLKRVLIKEAVGT